MLLVVAAMVMAIQQGKPDDEIIAENTTDKIGDNDCTEDLLNELLDEAKGQASENQENKPVVKKVELFGETPGEAAGTVFGNKDKKKEHAFPAKWVDHVVVRESEMVKVGNSDKSIVENPDSVKIQPFDKSLYKIHVKQGMFKGKTVVILHEPK